MNFDSAACWAAAVYCSVLRKSTRLPEVSGCARFSVSGGPLFREAVNASGRLGIGETPIFSEGSIRGMSGYGMAACGAKRSLAKALTSAECTKRRAPGGRSAWT
jgi:hypothetical protein